MTLLFNQPRQCHYNFPLAWRIPLCTQNTVSGPLAGVLDWRKREICFCPLLQPRSSFFLSTDSTPTAINHSHLSLPKQPMATHTRGGARPRRRTHTRPSSPAREADPPAHVAAPSPRRGVRRGGAREQPPPAKSATSVAQPSNRRRSDLPHPVGSTLHLSLLPSMAHTGGNRRSLAASPPPTRVRPPSCKAPFGVGPAPPLLELLLLGVFRASPLAVCPHDIM
jgi:hypothetical protein